MMNIRIAYDEVEQSKGVKAAGGKWEANRQPWQLTYEKVIELGLRIGWSIASQDDV